jgi:predicted CXXCH cytochrome family protein
VRGWNNDGRLSPAGWSFRSTKLIRECLLPLLIVAGLAVAFESAQPRRAAAEGQKTSLARVDRPFASMTAARISSQRCESCHRLDPMLNHPTDVSPSMAVPASLPLQNGKMACTTCHLNDDGLAHSQARAQHTAMLRGSAQGLAFCLQCHGESAPGSESAHGMLVGRAHLQKKDRRAATSGFGAGRSALDRESRDCMSCHDGSAGPDVGKSHTVGVRYDEGGMGSTRRRSTRRMAPLETLQPRIRLFDERVGCGSCHSPYAATPDLLVMPNDQGQLCVSCHRGK